MGRDHQVVIARVDREIPHRHARQVAPLVVRPALPAVQRHPQADLGAKKEQILIHQIFFYHVGIAAYRRVGGDEG